MKTFESESCLLSLHPLVKYVEAPAKGQELLDLLLNQLKKIYPDHREAARVLKVAPVYMSMIYSGKVTPEYDFFYKLGVRKTVTIQTEYRRGPSLLAKKLGVLPP